MKIEAVGNTKKNALSSLDVERLNVMYQTSATFDEIKVYGNSELGYKVVQYYKTGIQSA